MKKSFLPAILFFSLLLGTANIGKSQTILVGIQNLTDSIEAVIKQNPNSLKSADDYMTIYSLWHDLDFDKALEFRSNAMRLYLENDACSRVLYYAEDFIVDLYVRGELYESMKYAYNMLEISKECKDSTYLPVIYSAMGSNLKRQKDWVAAINMYKKVLSLKVPNRNGDGLCYSLTNLIECYSEINELDSAIYYYPLAMKAIEKYSTKIKGVAMSHAADVYLKKGEVEKALALLNEAVIINVEERYSELNAEHSGILINLAKAHYSLEEYKVAKGYAYSAFAIANDINVPLDIERSSSLLAKIYKHQGKIDSAFYYQKMLSDIKDTIEASAKIIMAKTVAFQVETVSDSIANANEQMLKQAEIDKQKAEIVAHRNQQFALYGGITLVLIFAGFIFNRYKITKQQNVIIQEQKKEVEAQRDAVEKQKHLVEQAHLKITDSIQYAKRIQGAILPPQKLVKEYLPNSFVIYKPKDVVAGDFYWMDNQKGKLLFAACDCTGHGVPGAMISVMCNNGLNRSVREYGLTDPGKILDQTREIVIAEFEKAEEDVKDGMDIALCALEGNTLQFAGANNPLWIIRNGEILETKANKQPIGKFDKIKSYTTHTFNLEKGDSIYIFTDGYVDQFGGEKGKKFMSKNFKKLLLSIQDKNMEEQRILLEKSFETWRGKEDQLDDVCVIGVKV